MAQELELDPLSRDPAAFCCSISEAVSSRATSDLLLAKSNDNFSVLLPLCFSLLFDSILTNAKSLKLSLFF